MCFCFRVVSQSDRQPRFMRSCTDSWKDDVCDYECVRAVIHPLFFIIMPLAQCAQSYWKGFGNLI